MSTSRSAAAGASDHADAGDTPPDAPAADQAAEETADAVPTRDGTDAGGESAEVMTDADAPAAEEDPADTGEDEGVADADAPDQDAAEAGTDEVADAGASAEDVTGEDPPDDDAEAAAADEPAPDEPDSKDTEADDETEAETDGLAEDAGPEPEPEPEPETEPDQDVEPNQDVEPDQGVEPAEVPEPEVAVTRPLPRLAAEPVAEAATDAGAPPTTADATTAPASPFDVFVPDAQHAPRWPRVLLRVGIALVVLGGGYVAAAYALADRVPRATTVAGVEIGSMAGAQAVDTLDSQLADRVVEPVPVTAADLTGSLDPVAAGLALDAQATVDRLTGVDLRPSTLWRHIVGGGAVAPVTAVDEEAFDTALAALSEELVLDPVDGAIVFVDGAPRTAAPIDGWQVDAGPAARVLRDGWLTADRPLDLPTEVTHPAISADEVDRAMTEVASQVGAGPVTVEVEGQSARLPSGVVVAAARFEPDGTELALRIDGEALVAEVVSRTTNLLTPASDATFRFVDGAPVIVPGEAGTTIDPDELGVAIAAAVLTPERTATVGLVQTDPAETTRALQALGVTEVVAEFATPLTAEPRRTRNIVHGAELINGTLLRPGDTFSLSKALGPIDAEHGFIEAGAIIEGEHRDAFGGGLSQLSTTTYNAGFFAGYVDVEHRPHSEWFTRYPAGREATLFTGQIDMKFRNDTPYGGLIQAWVGDGQVHVRIWSTKHWTVETTTSGKWNVVQPRTVYSSSPTCEAQPAGNPGFTVRVTRTVSHGGVVDKDEANTWTYRAQNQVICGPDPGAAQPTTPAG